MLCLYYYLTDLNREQDMCHDTVNNIISDQQSSKALRVRHLPGDKLSVRKSI